MYSRVKQLIQEKQEDQLRKTFDLVKQYDNFEYDSDENDI